MHALARQQDFFITPYADVDVSALAHAGLDSDVNRALAKGGEVTAGQSQLGAVQRPAGATYRLARRRHRRLRGARQPGRQPDRRGRAEQQHDAAAHPVLYTPSAITSTLDGVNAGLHVALADSTLTQVLADAPTAASRSAGATTPAAAAFATEQRFLAETAMIVAEQPGLPRSVVVTPPRQWNPAPGLASALLTETDSAPWLQPASLSSLLAKHSTKGQVPRQAAPAAGIRPR